MLPENLEARWRDMSADVARSMAEWRGQHPQATFQEIERAVDERLGPLRARMLEDAALASRAADLRAAPPAARPRCPSCETPLEERTQQTRTLQTQYGQEVTLERSYAVCPRCGQALFPPR